MTFQLAKDFVGADIPDTVLKSLKPDHASDNIYSIARNCTFAAYADSSRITQNIAMYSQTSVGGKLKILFQRFFPSRLLMAKLYQVPPDSIAVFLKYPRRWKDLFINNWRTITDLRGRDQKLVDVSFRKNILLNWLFKGP